MIEIAPFEPGHLAAIAPAWPFARDGGGDLLRRAALAAEAGPAWTALVGGEPAACAGVAPLWPGVAEAWSFAGAAIGREALAFHRAVARGLADAERDLRLHRVQAACRADHVRGRRWLALLGFEEEGLMRRYGPEGRCFVRFARVGTPWPTR